METNYIKIIELIAKKKMVEKKINNLKPKAIKELYKIGYSMDDICSMLKVGKINVVDVLRGKKKKFLSQGRYITTMRKR